MDVNWVAVLNFAVSETSKKLVKLFFAENSLSPAIQNSLNNISMPINPIKLSFVTKKIEINEEHKRILSAIGSSNFPNFDSTLNFLAR